MRSTRLSAWEGTVWKGGTGEYGGGEIDRERNRWLQLFESECVSEYKYVASPHYPLVRHIFTVKEHTRRGSRGA